MLFVKMITEALILISASCLYYLVKCKYSHWSRKGVKGPTPLPFVGNFGRMMIQKQSITQLGETAYKQYPNEKFVGLYCGFTPVLLLRDPELINQVLTTDFSNFVNRGVRTAEEGFSNNLLISEDEMWRMVRQKITPAFTSAKLKQMMPLIQECVNRFLHQVEIAVDIDDNCDVKELAAKYAMEVICSCGFGINLDFYSDEIKEFSQIGKEAITPSVFFRLWYAAEMLIPGIQSMLPAVDPTAHLRDFFIELVTAVIDGRNKTNEKRHDFMEIMIKLMHEGNIKVSENEGRTTELNVDINFIASQVFVFYTTGFETSSSTLSYLLYELALNNEYQDKAYKEICSVLSKHQGKLTYESVNEMTYLQKVFKETLRRHSFVGWIIRKTAKDYNPVGTNINVKAGTYILVSTTGLHSDPKYFEAPEVFNPENCSTEKLHKIPQCAYIPFGNGPRNCIGLRFAEQHVMMAAASFLSKFKISPCTDKEKKVRFDSISITLSPVDGVWIKISKRK